MSSTPNDPHGMEVALGRLMGGTRRSAKPAALVAATAMHDGEMVETVVAGRFLGHDGVAVLTSQRLLLANTRPWDPEVVSINNLTGLSVEGWVERRAAVFRFTDGPAVYVFDRIPDTEVAESFAAAVRAR